MILFFILSCNNQPEIVPEPASRESLGILDINVWSGLDYEGILTMGEYETDEVREKRYQALIIQIKSLRPDIIGVHEANKLPDYAKRLARDLQYDVFYHVGIGGVRLGPVGLPWNLREGDAILTKKDLNAEFVGRQQLSGGHVGNFFTFHFSDATQILAVRVFNQGKPLYIFATHWHASLPDTPELLQKAREWQEIGDVSDDEYKNVLTKIKEGVNWRMLESEKTTRFIKKTAGNQPFILMGDFNATADSREIRNLLQFSMVDVFQISNPNLSGFTWNPESNLNYKIHYLKTQRDQKGTLDLYSKLKQFHRASPKRIDYIFLGPDSLLTSQKISIKSSRVVLDEIINDLHASDHYGIYAEIEFKEHVK
ncbi:MAG: endonuclease/exonuclease/phosphatase family protein [bacterium]